MFVCLWRSTQNSLRREATKKTTARAPLPQSFLLLLRLNAPESTRGVCACPPSAASSVSVGSMKAAGQGLYFVINTKKRTTDSLFVLPPHPTQPRQVSREGTRTHKAPLPPRPLPCAPPPSKPECIGHFASSRLPWPRPPLPLQAPRHTSLLLPVLLLLLLRRPLRRLRPCHGTGVNTKVPRRSNCGRRGGGCRW